MHFCLIGFSFLLPARLSGQIHDGTESGTIENLIAALNEKNISAELRPLLEDFGGFGSSVHVRIPPADGPATEAGGTFVLAVPLDSAFAVETAFEFIEAAKKAAVSSAGGFRKELLIAFLGDEKSAPENAAHSHKGLRDLAGLPDVPATWALCYLDGDPAPESLEIRHGAGDYIAPLELIKPLPLFFDIHGIPFSLEARYNELYKLGLVRSSGELALLWAGEISGLCLYAYAEDGALSESNASSGSGRKQIGAAELAAALLAYAQHLRLPLEEPDQHYTIFSLPSGLIFFVSEKTSVLLFLAGAAALFMGLLAYSVKHRVKLISRLILFLRRGWIFFLFVPIMILIVLGSGLIYGFFHEIFNVPLINAGFWSSVLIIVLAIWFFYILSTLLDFLHFPRKADLYGVSAIIIAAMGLFAAAAMDLTYIAIFLVAFLFSFIAGNSKRPVLVLLSSLLIPLRALGALNNIRESGGMPIYMFIISGNSGSWMAAYQIAVLCLPVMLLLKRSMILFSHTKRKFTLGKPFRYKIKVAPSIVRVALLCLILVLMIFKVRFFTDNPEQTRRSFAAADSRTFSVSLSQTVFQESRIVNITLQSRITPLEYSLRLKSETGEQPLVYSASVPVERLENNSLRFVLGENPPNPLAVEIVLRRDYRGVFEGEAVYDKWEPSLDAEQPAAPSGGQDDYRLRITGDPVSLGEPSPAR